MLKKLNDLYLKQRFRPNIISIFINPFYLDRKSLLKYLKNYTKNLKGDLLDYGCGAKPYKYLFENISSYIGIDIENDSHNHENEYVDIFYDGKKLPFKENSFDVVFSTEVLEHVENIEESLNEINRVLKCGGKLLISVPFIFPEHEMPYDFRRLTAIGLKRILEENGFNIISLNRYGKSNNVISQLMIMHIHNLFYTKNKYFNLLLNIIFIFPITLLSLIFSFIIPNNKSLYFGTILLAEKK